MFAHSAEPLRSPDRPTRLTAQLPPNVRLADVLGDGGSAAPLSPRAAPPPSPSEPSLPSPVPASATACAAAASLGCSTVAELHSALACCLPLFGLGAGSSLDPEMMDGPPEAAPAAFSKAASHADQGNVGRFLNRLLAGLPSSKTPGLCQLASQG